MPVFVNLELYQYVLIGLAALAAGMVNALAGGGTLITFPMLTAVGLPAIMANVTNTVALCPGYLGGTLAQLKDLKAQKSRAMLYLPVATVGGIVGGVLLLNTGEKLFQALVPFLILFASALLAVSDPLRAWILRRLGQGGALPVWGVWAALPIFLAGIYGGFFGAGLGVIVLAVLGFMLSESLTQLNALKQAISFCVNTAAAIFFVFSGNVHWPAALVMAVFALIGGSIGGRVASRVKPSVLRYIVVVIGVIVAIIYWVK